MSCVFPAWYLVLGYHLSIVSIVISTLVSPSGKITVYLGRRDFVDTSSVTDPIDGVIVCDNDYLKGRRVFASVSVQPGPL